MSRRETSRRRRTAAVATLLLAAAALNGAAIVRAQLLDVCPQRCTGARALRPGVAPCLLPAQEATYLGEDDGLVWDSDHFAMPPERQSCHLGMYFADGGSCPLRLPSKADILNCHREEMSRSDKRTRFIFVGASNQFNTVKTLIDILDEGRGTEYSTRGKTRPPYNASWASHKTSLGWGGTDASMSGSLDVIFDSEMNLRYIKEGGGRIINGAVSVGWMARREDVKAIQDAPDFGPGSVRITWFYTRFGVDLDASLRLAMGLRAQPSPLFNEQDLAHPRLQFNELLNNYSATGDLPPEETAHYSWTAEESTIIDVQVSLQDLTEDAHRFRYGSEHEDPVATDREYMREWLINLTTPAVRTYMPVRSVIWSDVYPQDARTSERSGQSLFMEDAINEIQAASDSSTFMPWRTSNELPYIDFLHKHELASDFDEAHGFILRHGRHSMKPWLTWYLAQFMGAVCSTEGGHISDCGSVAWFRHECYAVGEGWRTNVESICTYGMEDFSVPVQASESAPQDPATPDSDEVEQPNAPVAVAAPVVVEATDATVSDTAIEASATIAGAVSQEELTTAIVAVLTPADAANGSAPGAEVVVTRYEAIITQAATLPGFLVLFGEGSEKRVALDWGLQHASCSGLPATDCAVVVTNMSRRRLRAVRWLQDGTVSVEFEITATVDVSQRVDPMALAETFVDAVNIDDAPPGLNGMSAGDFVAEPPVVQTTVEYTVVWPSDDDSVNVDDAAATLANATTIAMSLVSIRQAARPIENTDAMMDDMMTAMMAGMLDEMANHTVRAENWTEPECTTCEPYTNAQTARRAAAVCTCAGFGATVASNGSNATNGNATNGTNSRCHLHVLHRARWLPMSKLCDSPYIWGHIVWYVLLLVLVVLAYCVPRSKSNTHTSKPQARRIDTSALTGLRGFAAMHVALGHHVSKAPVFGFLYGNTAMPFFYQLSGFIMVIAYAAKPVASPCGRTCNQRSVKPDLDPDLEEVPLLDIDGPKHTSTVNDEFRVFEVRRFWRNRFARLFPVYMATNLLSLPLTYHSPRLLTITGQNSVRSLVFGSLGLTSWSGLTRTVGQSLPGPNSFLFPPNNVTWTISTMFSFYLIFPFVAPLMQNKSRATYQRWVVGLFVLQLGTWVLYASLFGNGFEEGYWHARAAPLSRIPVFLMGCAGGFLRLQDQAEDARSDGTTTDRAFCAYLVIILSVGLVSSGFGYDLNLTSSLEALCPPLQLAVILDLTRDAGQSRTAQFCKTTAMTTLGDISMSFYMVHYSVMMYLALLHDWYPMPWRAVPYSLSLSLVIGYGATHYLEKPVEAWLRAAPREKRQPNASAAAQSALATVDVGKLTSVNPVVQPSKAADFEAK